MFGVISKAAVESAKAARAERDRLIVAGASQRETAAAGGDEKIIRRVLAGS